MLNESLFLLSFDELKNFFLQELTIFHVALVYVLMYVIYKALGRYIYFKPQEHASKVNRTFLTLSLLVVILHSLNGLIGYLPFPSEYRWFYALCALVIFIAPLSILMDRIIWKYSKNEGSKDGREWHYYYLSISKDYYKASISKSESSGSVSRGWEEEGVESTTKNIHSDALLNMLALIIFITVNGKWTYYSAINYNSFSYIFSVATCLTISGMFFDRAIFSWILFLERKIRISLKRK